MICKICGIFLFSRASLRLHTRYHESGREWIKVGLGDPYYIKSRIKSRRKKK